MFPIKPSSKRQKYCDENLQCNTTTDSPDIVSWDKLNQDFEPQIPQAFEKSDSLSFSYTFTPLSDETLSPSCARSFAEPDSFEPTTIAKNLPIASTITKIVIGFFAVSRTFATVVRNLAIGTTSAASFLHLTKLKGLEILATNSSTTSVIVPVAIEILHKRSAKNKKTKNLATPSETIATPHSTLIATLINETYVEKTKTTHAYNKEPLTTQPRLKSDTRVFNESLEYSEETTRRVA